MLWAGATQNTQGSHGVTSTKDRLKCVCLLLSFFVCVLWVLRLCLLEADAEMESGAQGIHFLKRKGKKAGKTHKHTMQWLSQQEALDGK